jgi:hypothetical protein
VTQQGIPAFEWSDDALRVRQYLYEFWCEQGHGPSLREVHEALGLTRGAIIAAYKQLELGKMIVVDQTSQNFNMLKMLPFNSFPSQVQVWIDDRFHSYAGCAMESVAISRMPPFKDVDLRLESYCACCLDPISVVMRNGELVSRSPETVRIHVSTPPWEWGIPSLMPMCDSMNYVADSQHADRYERTIGRRGVLFTIEQARPFVKGVADARMWDYHWPNAPLTPGRIIDGIRALGVDVSNWDPAAAS